MSSLKRILEYDSSSDSDCDETKAPKLQKVTGTPNQSSRITTTVSLVSEAANSEADIVKKQKLKVPSSVIALFSDNEKHTDMPKRHGGRSRSFAHVRGNWASFVHVPYPMRCTEIIVENISKLLSNLNIQWAMCDDCHVTLSRTVSLPHHFIEPLYHELTEKVGKMKSFKAVVQSKVQFYVNDEKTRTFAALKVDECSRDGFLKLITSINSIFKTFNLLQYYNDPSIHISFAWTCEDVTSEKKLSTDIQFFSDQIANLSEESPHLFEIVVDKVHFKSGNMTKIIHLQ